MKWFRRLLPSRRLRGPASESIRRLRLPNGQWWDLETRPTVRQFLEIEKIVRNGAEDEKGSYEVLRYLTMGWSFREEVTVDAIMDRHIDELIEAMSVFTLDIVPFLEQAPRRLRLRSYSSASPESGSPPSTK